ncbi:hypothetical protein ACC860_36980, partial [Rhizobium ruizarguesonis]
PPNSSGTAVMDSNFWAFQAKDWINILLLVVTGFAVSIGPIRAVKVARRAEVAALKLRQQS